MKHYTRVKYRLDPLTGLNWHDKCRHGDCRFRAHTKNELEAHRIADAHDAYHMARWSA